MTATTTIHIEISHPTRVPIRRHVHIPESDQLTQDWFDSQTDQSASVRLLIRDDVNQHGMTDRVTREKFGSVAAQLAAHGGASAFTAPTTPQPAAATAAAVPTPWNVPLLDPKDDEIARLRTELAQRDAELTSLRDQVAPYATFLAELRRNGLVEADGLLV